MPTRVFLECSVCQREIRARTVELRMVVAVDEADGRHHEHDLRADTCSPGCFLTACKALSERAFGVRSGSAQEAA